MSFDDLVDDWRAEREGKGDSEPRRQLACYTPECPGIDCADCPIERGRE